MRTATNQNQPTTEQRPSLEHLMRDLDMARAMSDRKSIAHLTAAIKDTVNKAFTPDPEKEPERARRIARIEASEAAAFLNTVTLELAHREALEAEAIKNGINAKLAANGINPDGTPYVALADVLGFSLSAAEQATIDAAEAAEVEAAHVAALEEEAQNVRDWTDFIDRNKAAKRASDNRSVEMGE